MDLEKEKKYDYGQSRKNVSHSAFALLRRERRTGPRGMFGANAESFSERTLAEKTNWRKL